MDVVAGVRALPRPGETVTDASLQYIPGGKGANQAVAAARLGAKVRMNGCVGCDRFSSPLIESLVAAGVDVSPVFHVGADTGLALIVVDEAGTNQIVVAPGANAHLGPEDVDLGETRAVLAQLEIPVETVAVAARTADFFCLNAAPAKPVDVEPDLLVVNRYEYEVNSRGKLVALTLGEEGARLLENGKEVARASPPQVTAVDGTAAGDAFTACLVVSHLEGRDWEEALRRACAAGAIAAARPGAQPSLPTAAEVDEILAANA